jgi:hypothetical protein
VPIARYFIVVGTVLAALLFIAGWRLPAPPALFVDQPSALDRTIIRIKSARKWPEKIVLDTSQPTIASTAVEEPPAAQSVQLPPDEPAYQSNLQALAQLQPDTPSAEADYPTSRTKQSLARIAHSKRVARSPVARRPARAEAGGGCCQFEWIDNGQAISRTRAASSWPMDWRAFTGRN